jgi:hypothetical protein
MTELERMQHLIAKGWKYDPITGHCYTTRGKVSQVINGGGYQQIVLSVNKKIYFVYGHRFAWFCYHGVLPTYTIDHINRIKSDNRIENLRDVQHKVNTRNRFGKGYVVMKLKKERKNIYRAQIMFEGKLIHLGVFDTPEQATERYIKAKKYYHGIDNKLY